MNPSSSFKLISVWTNDPKNAATYLSYFLKNIFYILMLHVSLTIFNSIIFLLMLEHKASMFMLGGNRRIIFEDNRKDLLIILSKEG